MEELRWIHGIIRENLAAIQALTDQVAGGLPAEQVQTRLKELAATNLVWRLQTVPAACAIVAWSTAITTGEDAHFLPACGG